MAEKKKPAFSFDEGPVVKVKKPVAYYCRKGEYTFQLPVYELDDGGKVKRVNGRPKKVRTTDPEGNNARFEYQTFKFDRLPIKDRDTGKTSARHFVGQFIISESFPDRWERKDELIEYLNTQLKNAHAHLQTADEYQKSLNPEAFQSGKQVDELKLTVEELQQNNEALKAKLKASGISIE